MMADDLGDEWWLHEREQEYDLSDDAKIGVKAEEIAKQNESHKTHKKIKASSGKGKKRKQKLEESKENYEHTNANKKKKRRKKKVQDKEDEYAEAVDTLSVLWTYFEKELRKSLSKIEIGDLKPESNSWYISEKENFTNHSNIEEFSQYLQNIIPNWEKHKTKLSKRDVKGSPALLIITSSAVRAVDLLRSTAKFRGGKCNCSKLFAKHMKVNEQIEKLSKNVVHLGIGTPNRILKLIESDGLHMKDLKYVVLDWSWRDVKNRSIYTMPDVKDDFIKLFQNYFLIRCKKSKMKVGCF